MRRRNKYMPLVLGLSLLLLIYVVVTVVRNLKIYFVFSTGIGPILFVIALIIAIVLLFLRGLKY